MKNVLYKNTCREIKISFSRFISIFAIVAMGVAFYAGVKDSVTVMKLSADKYYDDYQFMDIEIQASNPLIAKDIKAIEQVKGVQGLYPAHVVDAYHLNADQQKVIRVHSIPFDRQSTNVSYSNQYRLLEGRMPKALNECVMEVDTLPENPYQIQDKITLQSKEEIGLQAELKTTRFTIVGWVINPYYLSKDKGSSSLGSGEVDRYIGILEENFKSKTYNHAFVNVKGAKEYMSYEEDYFRKVKPVKEAIEEIARTHSMHLSKRIEPTADRFASTWNIKDRKQHLAFMEYGNNADRMDGIAKIFPVFFIIVAVLVALTSMTRMVEEQQNEIGILKALGYGKKQIAQKYFIYVAIATVSGGILGAILGMLIFPSIIYVAWSNIYSIPTQVIHIDLQLALGTITFFIILTFMATYLACYQQLRDDPAILMRPRIMKKGKRILLEKVPFIWKRISFTYKVTIRNIYRYKKQFFMTIIGLLGCSALILAGFGIKDSISKIVPIQYGEINHFDMNITTTKTSKDASTIQLLKSIRDQPEVKSYFMLSHGFVTIKNKQKTQIADLYVSDDFKKFNSFFKLRSEDNHKPLILHSQGAFISAKMAKNKGLKVGDDIVIQKGNIKKKIKIANIVEYYIGHSIFMSETYYRKVFKDQMQEQNILIQLKSASLAKAQAKSFMELAAVDSISIDSTLASTFDETIQSLNYIVIVLIICSGFLACIVLYNLGTINISERTKEIATIKVLGFYDREVSSYVFRESIVLSMIGACMGLFVGIWLHQKILALVELENVMFVRNISSISFVYAFFITLTFALLVNFAMFHKLKKIKMAESLKSIE